VTRRSDEVTGDTTSAFSSASFLNEADGLSTWSPTARSPIADLPPGSALVVVKRGPNAGSRFLLDQPVTSAGRHPGSNIFLDDVTVSRRHAEFRWENDEVHIIDVGSLNGTYVNRQAAESVGAGQRRRGADRQVPPDVFDHAQEPRWRGRPVVHPRWLSLQPVTAHLGYAVVPAFRLQGRSRSFMGA